MVVAGISGMIGIIVWVLFAAPYDLVVSSACALIALVSLGGAFTKMTDASVWVYSKMKRRGVECDFCHHINSIRPWSL